MAAPGPHDSQTERLDSVGTAILGGGPAGLTGAYVLARRGATGVVYEGSGIVGGIAQTVEVEGYRFDLGGHRFFTKLGPIQRLWEEMLGEDFLVRPRLSRIYYDGKFLAYPLSARDVFARLGLVESARCALSYLAEQIRPRPTPVTFEDWVTARFGRRLYNAFFSSYTEKVWGIPGSEIRAEWAAQRIRDFSLLRAMLTILHLSRGNITTLIEEFRYPRLGPGQMWEAFRDHVEEAGIPVVMGQRCVALRHRDGRVESIVVRDGAGEERERVVDAVLSSMPVGDLVRCLDPAPPPEVLEAAGRLRHRSLCLVALMTTERQPFPDNWIYLHDPGVVAGRMQNFGAWSPDMVRPGTTCLGVEYFCFEGDEIWTMPEEEAVALAARELGRIGLLDPSQVTGGARVRVPKAYPVYDADYAGALETLRPYVEGFENLRTCGRNGLHRYNNQDHSMWTAILATLDLLDGTRHDVWSVNTDAAYHEQGEVVEHVLALDPADGLPDPVVATP